MTLKPAVAAGREQLRARAVELVKGGYRADDISRRLGISKSTLMAWAREAGVVRRPKPGTEGDA
jgi:transposase-like protein